MKLRLSVVLAMLALSVACDRGTVPSSPEAMTPAGPSALPAASTPSGTLQHTNAVQGRQDVMITIADACDSTTFNAALGPGACTRVGGVQFDQFIATLTRLGFIGPWHFAPNTANIRVGQNFVAVNKGGEVHTFTEVEQFGGGIVPSLNGLAGVPDVAPECSRLEDDDFVAPGATYREEVKGTGRLKFQCCIHPWMKLEAEATSR